MQDIDSAKAAQVWQRVLAGREGLVADWAETPKVPGYSGDLPPVRTAPPGLSGWNTYDVFPVQKKRRSRRGGTSTAPLLALLFALLVISEQTPKTLRSDLLKKSEKTTSNPPSA